MAARFERMTHDDLIREAWRLPDLTSMSKAGFVTWLTANPRMYGYFRKFAHEALEKKRKRFSAYMIRERVRWYVNVEYDGQFKISNNLTPYIARLLIKEYPELSEVFQIKAVDLNFQQVLV